MSTTLKVLLGLLLLGLITVAIMASSVIGSRNSFNAMEKGLVAQYEQNQNNYDNMWKKFKESAQVTEIYSNDVQKVYNGAIQGRYGANGSQAVFQMIKEQNPNMDTAIYKRLQETLEAGRDSFEENQKILLDKKRAYETALSDFPGNLIASFWGFPKIDLSKIGIVTSGRTQDAFETKKDEEIKLR